MRTEKVGCVDNEVGDLASVEIIGVSVPVAEAAREIRVRAYAPKGAREGCPGVRELIRCIGIAGSLCHA